MCGLEPLKLGEFFNQLFHCRTLKLYCNLRVFPVAFAAKDDAFAIFWMADALAAPESSRAGGCGNVEL